MFSKLLLIVLTIGLTHGALAAEEKKVDAAKTWKDKIVLTYHGEYGILRKSKVAGASDGLGNLKDFSHFHNPTIGWKFDSGLKLTSSFEIKYADHTRAKFPNRFYRALVSLSKTNLLTEKEFGLQVDGGIARRYFDRVAVPSTYGNNRINVTFTKNWGDNNASLFAQYLENDPKTLTGTNAATDATWRRGVELIPTLNLQLTDRLSFTSTDDININTPWFEGHSNDISVTHEFSFAVFTYKLNDLMSPYVQLKYNHVNDFDFGGREDNFEYYIGSSYSITPKITFTAEMGAELIAGSDNKTISEKASKPEFTLYLDAAF